MADAKPKVLILGGVYVCVLVYDTTVVCMMTLVVASEKGACVAERHDSLHMQRF